MEGHIICMKHRKHCYKEREFIFILILKGNNIMKTTKIVGQLEIDHIRGVIYFHADDKKYPHAITVLRICRLGVIPKMKDLALIDITHMHSVSFSQN